ncbi:MAG TPA: serine hydrolase [Acidobacteriota bacterium]|nr:serine hydrolase [Acidobacteriota bacterium]
MKRTVRLIVPILVLFGIAAASAGGAGADKRIPRLQKKNLKAVTADLRSGIPVLMSKAKIPGLQIAIVRDGKVAWQHGFGVRNAQTGLPVTNEILFEAASLTKPFFAYAVMKMVDEGLIDLARPLHSYFSREEIEKGLGHSLDAPGFKRDWFERITIRHVLSHSGGLPHGERGDVFPIFFEPGTKWKYSADGYEFLQYAVEKLKGEKLDAIMQKYVLDPLGMTRSGMVWRPSFEEVMANGHSVFGTPQGVRKYAEASAAASLYTTAGEYARFVCAVLNGEGLKPATAKEMLTSFIDMKDDKSLGWSLGFGLQNDRNGTAFWQWGDYGIFRNYVIGYPKQKTAVVYLTNSFNGLSVCADVVRRSVGGQSLGSAELNYRPYDAPFYTLLWGAKQGGPERVRAILPELHRKNPDALNWETLGGIAGLLSDEGLTQEAVPVYEYIAKGNPGSGRAAFELARACALLGRFDAAREHYREAEKAGEDKVDPKSIAWDLDYLQAAERPFPLDEEYQQKLVGEYEVRQISLKDGQLYYFRVGGTAAGPRPLLALSKDTFFIQGTVYFRIKLEFDESGRPIKLVGLYDDGRRDENKRTR